MVQLLGVSVIQYLVITVEPLIIVLKQKLSDILIAETNAIIEITNPYNCIMVFNGSVPLKPKTTFYGLVIPVPIIIVGKSCSQVSCNETESSVGIIETNCTSSFIAANS